MKNSLAISKARRAKLTASNVPSRRSNVRRVEARYDAAQTTPENARHWEAADGLSPVASNSEAVRKVLRERARHEIENNSWAKGMVETIADDTVGTGPRIQIRSGKIKSKTDDAVELAFKKWCKENGFGWKIRLGRKAKIASGEVFYVLTRGSQGPAISTEPRVELGINIVEADQVATPNIFMGIDKVSGIEFDRYKNPTFYHVLRHHPGASGSMSLGYDRIPAKMVLHYFERHRPGDARGIPEITPALPLYAYLRRYSLATVNSAEHIANIAGMLHTDAPADGDAEALDPLDTIDMVRGELMVLPEGWKYDQARAEQPTATFVQFRDALLGEIGRALNIPFNIAAGNSSGYNYASGRLDHQAYYKTIKVERTKIIETILDPIFEAWFAEARLVNELLPPAARSESYRRKLRLDWFWDGAGHVDPVKEAKGQEIRLANGTTTLAIEAAREGYDWRDLLDQQAEEQRYKDEIGLVPVKPKPDLPPDDNEESDPKDKKEQEAKQ